MNSPWIFVVLIIVALITLTFRLKAMRRSNKKSGYPGNGKSFGRPFFDKRNSIEYYTSCLLKELDGEKRILFNLRIPSENDSVTVIDLLMAHPTGFYVFLFKNYGGRLAGDEVDAEWILAFPNGRKETFPNPVRNANISVRALRTALGDMQDIPCYVYLVFGDRCQMHKITDPSLNAVALKKNELESALQEDIAAGRETLSAQKIEELYGRLKGYSRGNLKIYH